MKLLNGIPSSSPGGWSTTSGSLKSPIESAHNSSFNARGCTPAGTERSPGGRIALTPRGGRLLPQESPVEEESLE